MTSISTLVEIGRGAIVEQSITDVFDSDASAIEYWLSIYNLKSPHTYRSYKLEATRWLAFLEFKIELPNGSRLKIATEELVEAYLLALGRPKEYRSKSSIPFESTVLPSDLLAKYRFRHQPFLIEHSPKSMARSLSAISSLYRMLSTPIDSGGATFLRHNPTARLGKMQTRTVAKSEKYFTPRVYEEMLHTIMLAQGSAKTALQKSQQARRRWIVVLIYGLWLRIAEATTLSMASFQKSHNVWSAKVVGKGRKERHVIVTSAVIDELIQYRKSLGLPALLTKMEEDIPAIVALVKRHDHFEYRHCNTSSIYREIKAVALATATRLENQDIGLSPEDHSILIQNIQSISPHWFRHSGASEAINEGYPLVEAAARLGHSDVNMTQEMYFHGEREKSRDQLSAIEAARSDKAQSYLN
jgi:integrase